MSPNLVLCGHSHFPQCWKTDHTVFVNPGNLGEYGNQQGGTFCEVEIGGEKDEVKSIALQRIDGKDVCEVKRVSFE